MANVKHEGWRGQTNWNKRNWFKRGIVVNDDRYDSFRDLGYEAKTSVLTSTPVEVQADLETKDKDGDPKWLVIWRRLLGELRAKPSNGSITQIQLAEMLGFGKNEITGAISGAKKRFPEEWAEFYELLGKKPVQRGSKEEVEEDPGMETDQPGDVETEEITEADVVATIINVLEGFDRATKTRLIATACVFHRLDFASLSGDQLVTSRPARSSDEGTAS